MPMSTKFSAGRVRSTYEFIKANRATFSVQVMLRARRGAERLLRVDHAPDLEAGAGRGATGSPDPRVVTASHGIYGAPRVFLDLREAGETCSKFSRALATRSIASRVRSTATRYLDHRSLHPRARPGSP